MKYPLPSCFVLSTQTEKKGSKAEIDCLTAALGLTQGHLKLAKLPHFWELVPTEQGQVSRGCCIEVFLGIAQTWGWI